MSEQFVAFQRVCIPHNSQCLTRSTNGVQALILATYNFEGAIWLCHFFKGQCYNYTAFEPALDMLQEVEAFLSAKPTEIVTIILEDYVHAPNGLTKVFTDARLMKCWFPVAIMTQNGQDWPLVRNMVSRNHRLLVFNLISSKEKSEGIAYQWNYMVENQYGDGGRKAGSCPNRAESSPLNDKNKSLVLVNYFLSMRIKEMTGQYNSWPVTGGLTSSTWTSVSAGGGGSFQAVDTLNGKLLCGCDDVLCLYDRINFLSMLYVVTEKTGRRIRA